MTLQQPNLNNNAPLYNSEHKLPEITVKAVVLSILLAIILGAANMYLALKIGATVAASIPAAVIALGIFRLFKTRNVLESNLVQTAASAGESIAAGAAFLIPALLIVGYWQEFHFWQIALLLITGGLLGVLFSIPLRHVLLNMKTLAFPEGTAIGSVLRASVSGVSQIKSLIWGGAVGGIVTLCQTGFGFLADHLPLWGKSGKIIFGTSFGFDPVLLGVGYIIGINACLAMLLGTLFGWVIGVPILSHFYAIPVGLSAEDAVMNLWDQHIRYIGVGTMLIAGIWAVCTLVKPVSQGLHLAFKTSQANRLDTTYVTPRTEQDIGIKYVLWGIGAIAVAIFFIMLYLLHASGLGVSKTLLLSISFAGVAYILLFGFISTTVAGYVVGLIGSSNSPTSGIFIINALVLSLLLFPLLSSQVNFGTPAVLQAAVALVVFILIIIGSTIVVTGETIQDLKAGQMVGATPWKQQTMMMIGVVVSALIIAPVLQLLFQAYGIGGVFPHPGMNQSQMLLAPQAGLIAALTQGVAGHNLPWNMLGVGVAIGLVCIGLDEILKTKGWSMAPLAVGLGIYLPPEVITPTVLGGVISYLATRRLHQNLSTAEQQLAQENNRGILLACGLVAGAALMGVILAVPFVIKGSADALHLVGSGFAFTSQIIAIIVTIIICAWMYKTTITKK